MRLFYLIFISVFIILNSCNSSGDNTKADYNEFEFDKIKKKEGLVTVYDEQGSIKSTLNFKKGIKHGIATTYFKNGKPLIEINYADGLREGNSIKYYEHGGIYAVTPYNNDKINGIRTLYYNTGEKKAEISYWNNFPGLGLKEYKKSGDEIDLNYNLKVHFTNKNLMIVSVDKRCKKALFYLGKLAYGSYLDPFSAQINVMSQIDQFTAMKELSNFQLQDLRNKNVICHCTTKNGNPLIIVSSLLM